ncbi:MAG: acetate--CoA ligase alpha subunit [Anaerolineae bacterium]|jgi:acetyl coenzyme A synthetase (ADP forming)-like protein
MSRLDMFFHPDGIAIIGASTNPSKIGYQILSNLRKSGYQGGIYPVNPGADEILGLKAYGSILDVPGHVDQAVIVIPSKAVPSVMEECGQKGVRGAVVITAGFRESGPEGRALEERTLEIASKYGIRMVGPNCLGLMDMWTPVDSSFAPAMTSAGYIAFTSQSGALGTAVLDYALENNIGMSRFISLGNKADVDEAALYEDCQEDARTKVLISYIEGVKDGKDFMRKAAETARLKPIIAVKSGRTASGSKAVSSHTGSLAGSDAAYDAAFMQSGIIRANSVQEMFDFSTAFAYQPLLKGNRICVVTNAGGPGVMATDALEAQQLLLAELLPETEEALAKGLPAAASTHNPVDVLGDATAERYRAAIREVLQDPNVDGVLVILTPQSNTEVLESAQALVDETKGADKPVLACWMGGHVISRAVDMLSRSSIPCYPFPERAVAAMGAMYRYGNWRQRPESSVETFDVDKAAVADLFARIRAEGRNTIGDSEAQDILKAYGIVTPRSTVAATPDEAVAYCHKIGYPVVMKIASPDILHKSDVGGIIVNVRSDEQVRTSFDTLIERAKEHVPNATIWGAQIQEMVTDAREIIIGMNRDPQFGPLVMFGLGGIYVEVLKDVTFRVAPMTRAHAKDMVASIRTNRLLTGVRGQAPSDLDAIVDTILRVSQLVTDFPEIAELDINPLLVRSAGQGAVAVDMRLILS